MADRRRNRAERRALTEQQFDGLSQDERDGFDPRIVDDELYYGYYSTPLAWVRPLEVLAENGMETVDSKRVLDFGLYSAVIKSAFAAAFKRVSMTSHGVKRSLKLMAQKSCMRGVPTRDAAA